jgi:hypothetical protein
MQKSVLLSVLTLSAFLSGCDKDDDGAGKLSKTDAKAEISEFNSTATLDLQQFSDAEGLNAIADLSDLTALDDPFGRASTDQKKLKSFFHKKGAQFRSIFQKKSDSGRIKGSEPFDFNANKGIYEWDFTYEVFVKTGSSSIIQIMFPTEGSLTNNAELQLTAYEEVHVYDEVFEEDSYEPSVLKAALFVESTEVASLDLDVEWGDDGFPLSGDLTAIVVPFTASVSFDVTASTKNTLTASLVRNQETLFATSIAVLYSTSAKTEQDLKSIEGFVQLKNLTLKGSIDVEGTDLEEDEIDLNDFIHLELLADGKKVGDIVFETEMIDGFEEPVTYIKYSDGSKEKLDDVLQPVIDELDQISEDLNG